MKLPRDLSGADLVKALARIGYRITRLQASHSVTFAPLPGGILVNARRKLHIPRPCGAAHA